MKTTIEKFKVRNRWNGAVQFTAEISVTPDMLTSVKLGLAIKWARASNAYLRGADLSDADLSNAYLRNAYLSNADLSGADLSNADLRGADLRNTDLSNTDLRGADLRGADLSGADLSGADLRNAYLSNADLRPIKADFFMILAMGHTEVPQLIKALRDGKVNGSTYEGECACLVGTLENGGAKGIPHQPSSPAEVWFAPIREGDKPGDDTEGGFRAKWALGWALEYARLTGIEVPA